MNTDFQSHYTSAAEAVRKIQSGQHVYLHGNCAVPKILLGALIDYAQELKDVEIYQPLTVTGSDYLRPELEGHLHVSSLFISPNVRSAVQQAKADFIPVLLSELPLLFKRGLIPLDVMFFQCAPPDAEGYCNLGTEAGLTLTIAEAARLRFAEINPQMPRTFGDTRIHISRLDQVIPVDYPLSELPMVDEGPSEVIDAIARGIAERIPDGATLQLGIGSIPSAVLGFLQSKKNLGLHAELISDGVIDLVEAGVIDGSRKTLHPGKLVAGFVLGTQRIYRWVDRNPLLELHRTEYVNDPRVVSQNFRMTAINSALQIDLTGQVCPDSIGPRFYSGAGGQFDFIYGASLAEDGLPIIGMPSTYTDRTGELHSRIVPTLTPGAGVVTTRYHVHLVATEYGLVDLYGKSVRQRVQLLAQIAHPAFRDELLRQARGLNYL